MVQLVYFSIFFAFTIEYENGTELDCPFWLCVCDNCYNESKNDI